MTQQALYVATRKGIFKLQHSGRSGDWLIAETAFLGRHASAIKHEPETDTTFVALSNGASGVELFRTGNGWSLWQPCTNPAFTETTAPSIATPTIDYIWTLETSRRGWRLWCGTVPGGLFMSNDAGETWALADSLWNHEARQTWTGGGFDQPGIHSICIHPTSDDRITIGVSCGGVWVSEDAGNTWNSRHVQTNDDSNIQNPHRVVQCREAPNNFWMQHHTGVFRSADPMLNWERVDAIKPSAFGFAAAVHPGDPNTAWFVPIEGEQRRIPVGGRMVVARTTDGGESFEMLSDGLPQEHAYGMVLRHGLDVSDDGNTLAFGTTTGSLWVSQDAGRRWNLVTSNLPPVHTVQFA